MRKEFLASGRGGQGILLLGHLLGHAVAKYTDLYITATESYDAETRGGDSKIDIIIADRPEELDYFKVRKSDIALFMYPYQLVRYGSLTKNDALVFIDSYYIKNIPLNRDWKVKAAPYTRIAEEKLGTHVVANMIALGHIIKETNLVSEEAILKSIKEVVRKRWVYIDIKAFQEGLALQGGNP